MSNFVSMQGEACLVGVSTRKSWNPLFNFDVTPNF